MELFFKPLHVFYLPFFQAEIQPRQNLLSPALWSSNFYLSGLLSLKPKPVLYFSQFYSQLQSKATNLLKVHKAYIWSTVKTESLISTEFLIISMGVCKRKCYLEKLHVSWVNPPSGSRLLSCWKSRVVSNRETFGGLSVISQIIWCWSQ